ncbi:unnamed protein product [Brachionus calyciflorus]|uniref:Ribosomal protein eL8/eL30/eS12/Gadd45 domain-containing protein n=1 Tax=Brachionus calyciflorus TaxID=104777 RepID=A0A814CFY9_9BILA|nr:unnamed protein product [Brachionus calyciflorus]
MTLSPNATEFIPINYAKTQTASLVAQPVQTFLIDPSTGTTSPIIHFGFQNISFAYNSPSQYSFYPNNQIFVQPGQFYYPYPTSMPPLNSPHPNQIINQPQNHFKNRSNKIREPYIADEKIFKKVVKNVNFIKQTVQQHYNNQNYTDKYLNKTPKGNQVYINEELNNEQKAITNSKSGSFKLNDNDFPELKSAAKTNACTSDDRNNSDAYSSDATLDANTKVKLSSLNESSDDSPINLKNTTTVKKLNQPLTIEFANMITALQKGQTHQTSKYNHYIQRIPFGFKHHTNTFYRPINPLDSNLTVKRGKEREKPKNKKKSTLKKIILREREEKRKQQEETVEKLESLSLIDPPDLSHLFSPKENETVEIESQAEDYTEMISPISQTSPLSYNPSPYAALNLSDKLLTLDKLEEQVKQKIHSKKFREYCNQIVNKDIDVTCTFLLHEISRFQDRLYHKNPIKAKMKRRYVMGIREVTKHLKLQKLKCVILAPNCEKIESKGGLDDAINLIIQTAMEQNIPFLFALGRKSLGKAVNKLVPISVIGIFDYSGAEEHFNRLVELANNAKLAYQEMVEEFEREECENLINIQSSLVNNLNPPSNLDPLPSTNAPILTNQIFNKIPSHMAHSRTPSNGSNISIEPLYHMNYHSHSRSASGTFNYGHTTLVSSHTRTASGGGLGAGGINLDLLVNNKNWTHSRTASNCSNISFISRLSEPISEFGSSTYVMNSNSTQAAVQFYTDQVRQEMKENEIIKDDDCKQDENDEKQMTESSLSNLHLGCINEIDAGNEADTEDLNDIKNKN